MTTLYVYNADNYQDHIDNNAKLDAPIAKFKGESNEQCEQLATDANYDDSEYFAWSYTKF